MITAAIAGLGRWGRAIITAAAGQDRIRFVSAVEPEMEGARTFCADHQLQLVGDLSAVLADRAIDTVFLATPHSLHRAQVIACAAAGKQVFCEKPLALHRTDAEEMFGACRKAGVRLAVGHNRRFWPAMQALRAIVAGGELGTLLHVEGHNSNENSKAVLGGWRLSPEESPGGGLTGAGLHALHALVSVAGPVRSVTARLVSRREEPPQLDTVSALLAFESGVTGTLATVRATPFYWRVHAFGTDGSAEVLDETTLVLRRSGAKPETKQYPPIDALRAELDAFADCLDHGREFPVPEAEVLATLAAFEATLRAITTGTEARCDGH